LPGNPTLPAPAIYGIAFTLAWDPLLTDSTTASFDFSTTSLGIPGMDMITFQHRDFSLGKVDVTMSRTDHANILLADSVVAEFSIRVAATAPLSTLEFELANVKALTSSEEELNFNLRSDSVVINPSITGIPPVDEPIAVSVFPVPARDRLMVKSASVIHSAVLFNALGKEYSSGNFTGKTLKSQPGTCRRNLLVAAQHRIRMGYKKSAHPQVNIR
jgi:hypothetical protein